MFHFQNLYESAGLDRRWQRERLKMHKLHLKIGLRYNFKGQHWADFVRVCSGV